MELETIELFSEYEAIEIVNCGSNGSGVKAEIKESMQRPATATRTGATAAQVTINVINISIDTGYQLGTLGIFIF